MISLWHHCCLHVFNMINFSLTNLCYWRCNNVTICGRAYAGSQQCQCRLHGGVWFFDTFVRLKWRCKVSVDADCRPAFIVLHFTCFFPFIVRPSCQSGPKALPGVSGNWSDFAAPVASCTSSRKK